MANITRIDPTTFELQTYESQDNNLISKVEIETSLKLNDFIEFYIYDLNQNILYSNPNYTRYQTSQTKAGSTLISTLKIDPENDLTSQDFVQGKYVAYYNFLDPIIGNNEEKLFISEISSDRTEIRLDSNQLIGADLKIETNSFIQFREEQEYFIDFYLNFGDNNLVIANNIKLDNENTKNPTIIVKLYESLPETFNIKSELFIVTTVNEPEAFQVDFPVEVVEFEDFERIAGPNFNIPLKGQVNNSTQPFSYNDIISSAPTSSQNQINSLLEEKSIPISVDYTDFNEFIHFSSAQTRIENFHYKVGLIESISASISTLNNTTGSSLSLKIEQDKISKIIKNFDRFEYFMYYDSGSSLSWPKTNSTFPYELAKTGSTEVLTWYGSINEASSNYGGRLLSASTFDNANPDQLLKSIPEYLREDPNNRQYELFVDMVAQYYDNVWLYTKDITQKYNADNRLNFGISKTLVANAIQDFGLKLYQNQFPNKDLYTAFLGVTPQGDIFADPSISGSLPVPTGMEFVDTMISASNDILPLDDTNKALYKRIYHNIPYLLKTKGTLTGLRALITSYGIPDTILRISEFGGKDQVNANDYDLYFNNFNNAHLNVAENYISSSWEVNGRWFSPSNRPSTVEFRFKSEKFPPTNLSQSLFSLYNGSTLVSDLVLEYNGSGSLSGSYSSSIQDPSFQYTNLKWIPDVTAGNSASISFPFLNNDWWSVMITSGSSNGFELTAANKIYNGNDGTSIGYISSSLINTGSWTSSTKAYFATSSTHEGFSGSLQEIRYYNTILSESVFKDYVMNPLSIEGNNINSTPDQLIFRAALGSELDTSTTSIHPKITGSYSAYTQSFATNSSFYVNSGLNLKPNTETFFLDQPAVGIKNRITDKIRSESDTLPSGSTLSPIRRLSQTTEASASYTPNINYLEVAFSPQNEINDDIIGQLGHFNIGDYIGDPRQRFSGSLYEDLNTLSKEYFKKYIKQYNLVDFVRLIKFFDNSLFKMIKDFIPARTSLASGIVVKQHLLERNKYKQPSVSYRDELLTGSISIATISGGAAGVFNPFNGLSTSPVGTLGSGPNNRFGITQSFLETHTGFSGSITVTASSQDEFYNGEFSGSTLIISNGELNEGCAEFKEIDPIGVSYGIRAYRSTNDDYFFSSFINPLNNPTDGFISTYFQDDTSPALPFPNPSS
tara:strand:+ start:3041 stop:6589 length:3549 start_codon:yes stop_codon:yes gene_type:complete